MDCLKQNLFQLIPSFSEMVVANLKKTNMHQQLTQAASSPPKV
jgi:hypothetical protein